MTVWFCCGLPAGVLVLVFLHMCCMRFWLKCAQLVGVFGDAIKRSRSMGFVRSSNSSSYVVMGVGGGDPVLRYPA